MRKATGSWLSGPSAAADPDGHPAQQEWRGQRLGLPEDGPGSLAGPGRRVLALLIDWLPCSIAAQLLTRNPALTALVLFAVLSVITLTVVGRTPGQAALGLRVSRMDGTPPGFGRAVIRTVLLCVVIPAVIWDADGRGMHDKPIDCMVVRTR